MLNGSMIFYWFYERPEISIRTPQNYNRIATSLVA